MAISGENIGLKKLLALILDPHFGRAIFASPPLFEDVVCAATLSANTQVIAMDRIVLDNLPSLLNEFVIFINIIYNTLFHITFLRKN
jgi:hypothetical protein